MSQGDRIKKHLVSPNGSNSPWFWWKDRLQEAKKTVGDAQLRLMEIGNNPENSEIWRKERLKKAVESLNFAMDELASVCNEIDE